MKNEITPKDWNEVYDALFHDTFNPRTHRFKSRYAYRGVSSKDYKMTTSLMRTGPEFKHVEKHLVRQFTKYAYSHIEEKGNEWFWLSVGQHHGLPTRLLDWSYSPDVALHFATSNTGKFDEDGAVWMVNYKKAHEYLPPAIRGVLEEEKTSLLTTDLMARMCVDLHDLDAQGREKGDFVLFFEPPSIDTRIYNQFAYFSIASRPDLYLDDWLLSHPDIWYKVIIKKELKWEIRDKLDQRNVSERTLFPGMGGLSQWLARYYDSSQMKKTAAVKRTAKRSAVKPAAKKATRKRAKP